MKRALMLGLLLLCACSKSVNITDNNAPVEDAGTISPGEDAGPEGPKTTLFVDPVNGNDANDGRSASTSLKSLKKALKTAVAGDTIELAAGKYSAGNGDDFKTNDDPSEIPTAGYKIPDDVTIKTAQPGGAILEGVGDSNLLRVMNTAKGTIKIVNLALVNGNNGIDIGGGTVEMSGMVFEKHNFGVATYGKAIKVTCAGCTWKGPMSVALEAQGATEVRLDNATFKDLVPLVAGNMVTVIQATDSSNVSFVNTTIESNEGCLSDLRDNAVLELFNSTVKNNKKGEYCSYLMLGGDETKTPTLRIQGGQVINNAGGAIYVNGYGKVDLNGTDISGNGDYGIQVFGVSTVKARYTKVKNHGVANIRMQASQTGGPSSKLLEPSVDFGNASEGGQNFVGFDNTPVPAGRFGLEMLYGSGPTPTSKTSTFIGTQWTFNTTQPTGTITSQSGNPQSIAPHYTIAGDGAKVVFSN